MKLINTDLYCNILFTEKYRKIKILEQNTLEQERPVIQLGQNQTDVERGGH